MSCGDQYKDLVVTAGSGYTAENPYGLFATPYDYSEWRELAFRMATKARKHLDRLQAASKTGAQSEAANALVDEFNVLVESVDALPGLAAAGWSGVQLEQSIAQAVAASVDAACIMESVDRQLAEVGVIPPEEAGGRKPKIDLPNITNTLLVLGLGYGLWVFIQDNRRKG